MFERFINRASGQYLLASAEGDAPAGGGGAPAGAPAPVGQPASPAPAARAAAPIPQGVNPSVDDPPSIVDRIKKNTIAVLRGAGIKIPKELRQTADPAQIVEFARDKMGKIKGGSKELKRTLKAQQQLVAKHEATIAELGAQNGTLAYYAETELGKLPEEHRVAIKRSLGLDPAKDVPVNRAAELLKAITLRAQLTAGMSPPAHVAPGASAGAADPNAPPASPGASPATPAGGTQQAAAPQAPAPQPAPVAPPSPTSTTSTTPAPGAPGVVPSIRQQYADLTRQAKENPGNPRLRIAARIFATQHAAELSQVPS